MLSEVTPLLEQDREAGIRPVLEQNLDLDAIFKAFDERVKAMQRYSRANSSFTADSQPENVQTQAKNEELDRENQTLILELERKDKMILQLERLVAGKDKEIQGLQKNLQDALREAQQFNMAAVQQAKDLKEMHVSRDLIAQDLEKITVERNQLLEILKNEKMRMADTLNEINELHETLKSKERLLSDEQSRLNQKYKDLHQGNKSQPLAPNASEIQLQRNVNTDIPTMIARKLVKFHSAEIYDIALNLNGSLIATCGGDRYVRVYDPLNLQNVSQFQSTGDEVLTSLCFSPSFECLLMGSTDSTAQLWQVSGWKLKARFLGHSDQVTAVGFIGAEKDTCISGSNDRQIKLWNVNTGACIKTVNTGSMVTSLACQHNVPFVITAHKDGSIRGYTLKQDSKPSFHHKNLFDDSITSISLSQDNNSALLCSKEGSAVKIYDLRMNKVVNQMKVKVHKTFTDTRYLNSYDHNRACFGPDENYIIAGNADSSIVSWKTQNGAFHKQLTSGQHEGVVLCVAYHGVSGQMFSADSRGNLVVWR